ncbi:MAG: methyl-accepting chemotaxis protein [candidate division Zixibacteria bacterium]|nr:methyl-accepting chemotaxis protein [candidate division Zixibacteria bacterium]
MNLSSIKIKIILPIVGVGSVLCFLLAFYSPNQARKLGNEILHNDAEFTANLLAENLALGMQTLDLDGGATLEQTLGLLNRDDDKSAIADAWIYNDMKELVMGLNDKSETDFEFNLTEKLEFEESDEILRVIGPMFDSDDNMLGYVVIDYSKQFLNDQASSNSINALLISFLAISATIIIGIILGRHVSRRINEVTDVIQDLAKGAGDLTKRLNTGSKDEIGVLAGWFNTFMDKLHDIIAQVANNAEELSIASNKVSSLAEELSAGVKEQTNQTSQVSIAIEEMTGTIVETSKNTGNAANKAKEASEHSQKGSRLANDTSQGMEEIVTSSEQSARNIISLSDKAAAIGEIIKVIDDIADQTNLLALNAAIEAARAGEQGRGFAVVADEVRKLADRTTKATGEVADTIKGIQTDVASSNEQMVEAGEKVDKGKELVNQTNNSLNEIYSTVETVQEIMGQVATAAEQQSAAAEQISKIIENTERISQESEVSTEQAASAAEELNRQTEELRNLVGGFKLRQDKSKNPVNSI